MEKKVATIPGDGIGPEVFGEVVPLFEATAEAHGFSIDVTELNWGSTHFFEEGTMMPEDGLTHLEEYDAILLGAVGHPDIPDHVTLNGLLLPIRKGLDQTVCIRPAVLFDGVESPLAGYEGGDIDFVIYRENTEGEYADVGGRVHQGFDHEVAIQAAVFTRDSTEVIVEKAFQAAERRKGKVTSITKSNSQQHSMVFWDEVVEDVAEEYPHIELERLLVDAASMDLIRRPEEFDVIVASNLFADILSDIAAIITGSLGITPSASINPSRELPAMFEPVHGSAFDIQGEGVANPLASILAGAMMFRYLDEEAASEAIWDVVGEQLADPDGPKTPDLGGSSSTSDVVDDCLGRLTD